MASVDYRLIADAVKFYKRQGYEYMEVPWLVSLEPYRVTSPADCVEFVTPFGYLVASGEQSFLELLIKENRRMRAFCVTPCFRDDAIDELHQRHFIKVELIETDTRNYASLLEDADYFFKRYVGLDTDTEIINSQSTDIVGEKTRIELGSYGWREWNGIRWAYGTGLAEPRCSMVLREEYLKNEL